jgi:hypothetical protein
VTARWLTEKIEYPFAGRSWRLLFTHRALLLCQDATGLDMLAANLLDPSSSLLRGLLYGLLTAAGAQCTLAEVGREFRPPKVAFIRERVISAWIASMADPKREPYRAERELGEREQPSWIRKWAYETSRDGLGIAEEKWLDMTPRQVQELEILRLWQLQREEYLVGIVASQIENFSMCHSKKVALPETFMMHRWDPALIEDEGISVGDKIAAYYAQFPSQGDAGPAPAPEARTPVILGAAPG